MSEELDLVPVKVSGDWRITYQELYDVEPDSLVNAASDDARWDCFQEDLLQVENISEGRLLDVGWYPSRNSTGAFVARLLQGTIGRAYGSGGADYDWQQPLWKLRTRSLQELIDAIQTIFQG